MPEFEFDVDASIAAGWDRFAARLAGFLRDLVPGATFDLEVPVHDPPTGRTPAIRFTASEPRLADAPGSRRSGPASAPGPETRTVTIEAEVSGESTEDGPPPLRAGQLDQLASLGWVLPADLTAEDRPRLCVPSNEASYLAHLVAGTMERVFGIPHPVFLHDVSDRSTAGGSETPAVTGPPTVRPLAPPADDMDFRPLTITDPDQATHAVAVALSEVYGGRVEADEHDVFTVPAGCVVLFVRVHQSMPLIVFRSPLISAVEDVAVAETEVAILNRDSLWCRYVFDGKTIFAESEFVDRVFVPVNFKIQLAEISAELDDVHSDLARRVAGKQWRDLHSADDTGHSQQ